MDGRLRRFSPYLAAAAGYAVLTVWFAWVMLRDRSGHLFADSSDGASFVWNYWELPHRVFSGQDPFATRDLFWPVGVHTAFSTNTPLVSMVAGPLQHLIGMPATTFVLGLLPIWLSGVAGYLLVLHVCHRHWPAFAAGAAFLCCPYRSWRLMGHLNLDHLELLAFGLLALLLFFESPTRKRAVLLGVVLGLTVLTDLNYATFLLLAALVIFVVVPRPPWRLLAARAGQAAAVTVVIALPLLVFLVRDLLQHEVQAPAGLGGADAFSADLLSWISPPAFHPWWGSHFARLSSGESTVYPGLAILGLAVLGALLVRRASRVWIVLALVFFVLSLGPFLHVDGHTGARFHAFGTHFSLPLPYLLLNRIPILNGARNPGRFGALVQLCLDVLAALAIVRIARGRNGLEVALSALLLVVTLIEFLPPARRDLLPTAVPAPYRAIAADRSERAVLEIPIQWRDGYRGVGDGLGPVLTGRPAHDDAAFLYYATEHHHPLVNGMVARLPTARWNALLGVSAYQQILSMQGDSPGQPASFTAADLGRLGIGWVVYHRDRPFPEVLAYVQRLGLPVAADDGTTIVWRVPPS